MSHSVTARRGVDRMVLLLSGVLFGSSFSLFKFAAGAPQSPLGLALWFSTLAAGLALIPLLRHGRWRWMRGPAIVFCLVWSLLGTTVPAVVLLYAARELPAGIVALGVGLVPMATFAGAIVVKHDRASVRRCAGLGLGAIAATLVVLPDASVPGRDGVAWMPLPIGVALCYAAEHLYYATKVPHDAPTEGLLFLMFACSALLLLPVSVVSGAFFVPRWPPRGEEWALLGVAAVTVLDYALFACLVSRAGAVFTSQSAYVVTVAGVLWGMLLFGERHSVWVWTALGLLLVGIFLVQPRKLR